MAKPTNRELAWITVWASLGVLLSIAAMFAGRRPTQPDRRPEILTAELTDELEERIKYRIVGEVIGYSPAEPSHTGTVKLPDPIRSYTVTFQIPIEANGKPLTVTVAALDAEGFELGSGSFSSPGSVIRGTFPVLHKHVRRLEVREVWR